MADDFTQSDIVNAKIRTRRGKNYEIFQKVFDAGELIYSIDKKRLRIGDSSTYGGNLVGNKVFYTDSFLNLSNIERYDLVYRNDTSTFYMLTGTNYFSLSSYIVLGGYSVYSSIGQYSLPVATSSILGGIKKGNGISVDLEGKLNVNVDGDGLQIVNDTLTINSENLALNVANAVATPIATTSVAGKVKISNGLDVSNDGSISVQIDNSTIKYASNQLYVDRSALDPFKLNNGVTDLGISTLKILTDSGLSLNGSTGNLSLTISDNDSIGGIILGQGLSGNNTGKVDVPLATDTTFGGGILGKALSSDPVTNKIDVLIDDDSIQYYTDFSSGKKYLYATINQYHPAVAKGWIVFNGTGSVGVQQTTISQYGNLSAFKNQTGVYTIRWPMTLSAAGTNYFWSANALTSTLGTSVTVCLSTQTLTSTIINVIQHNGSPVSSDSSVISFSFNSH